MAQLLNEFSEKVIQKEPYKIQLKDHQLASVSKMIHIESGQTDKCKSRFGVLANRVGSGKSYIVLELVKQRRHANDWNVNGYRIVADWYELDVASSVELIYAPVTVLVVPHSLHAQWINYMDSYGTKYLLSTNKGIDQDAIKTIIDGCVDIVLVKSTQYSEAQKSLEAVYVSRVVFDEARSVIIPKLRSNKLLIKSKFVWALDACGTEGRKQVFDIFVPRYVYEKVLVKCEDAFIERSMTVVQFIHRPLLFAHNVLTNVMRGSVSYDVLRSIEAGAYDTACRMLGISMTKTSTMEIAKTYVAKIESKIKKVKTTSDLERYKTQLASLKSKLEEMMCIICYDETKETHVMTKCCNNVYCTECLLMLLQNSNCAYCRRPLNDTIMEYKQQTSVTCSQVKAITQLLEKLLQDRDKRILVCSYYTDNFDEIKEFIKSTDRKYAYIKGTARSIAKTVERYNEGTVSVLFLHAQYNAAGLNLNATTDIILMFNTCEMDKTQLIGRAQRPVRTCALVVHECTPVN